MESDDETASLLEESSDSDNEIKSSCTENNCSRSSSRGRSRTNGKTPTSRRIYLSQSSLPSPVRHTKRGKPHPPALTRYLSSPGFLSKALRFDPQLRYLKKKCNWTRSLERQPTIGQQVVSKNPENHRLHQLQHPHHLHQHPHSKQYFPRFLFRNATDVAFTVPKLYVRTLLSGSQVGASKVGLSKVGASKIGDMTKGNLANVPNGGPAQDSAFSQSVAFRDESPFGQNIELSTLKFADETPSVDENLAEWLLSSGQSTTPSTSGVTQNPPHFDVSVSLTDGPSSFDSEKSIQNNCFTSLTSGLDNNGSNPNCNSNFYEGNTNPDSQNNNPLVPSSQLINSKVEHSHHVPDIEIIADDDTENLASAGYGGNQFYQQQQQQHQHQHQNHTQAHNFPAGDGWDTHTQHVSFLGDRRLPDVVAIDECYRENEDNECSTICLVANIDSMKKNPGVISIDPPQMNAPKQRGAHQDRKERASLRRGVMMRQMSINPDVQSDVNVIPDPNVGGQQKAATDANFQENAGNVNINNNNINNNNNLSNTKGQPRKCSFSRNIIPPTVVVEEEGDLSKEDWPDFPNRDIPTDAEKQARRPSGTPRQNSRPKMKHLSQNSTSTAAMRFRLTFDETADAAANTVIGLPDEVSPQIAIGGKRPSCICGEPELPREYIPESDSGGILRTDQCPLIARAVSPNPMCVSPKIVAPPHLSDCNNSSFEEQYKVHPNENTFIATPCPNGDVTSQFDSISHSEPVIVTNSYTAPTTNLIQTLPDPTPSSSSMCHPRITIRISNSQQSFTPLLGDSPIPGMDGSFDNCDSSHASPYFHNQHHHHHHHHNTDNISCREDSVSPYPDSHYNYSYTNEPNAIPSEESQLLADHFHHPSPHPHQTTDTVQAPPIQDLYRYHVFFSHCPEDRDWVEHMVAHLESPPFNYTCAYTSIQDEYDQTTLQQRLLCAAMLSERVVLVLSNKYVADTWFSFEKTLKQLTQMSLHNQRIMGVLLEDCVIPDSLGELYFLDACDPDFFHVFTKRLKTSRIPRSSASVSSDLGQNAVAPSNVTNGNVLTFCRLQVKVGWDSYLVPPDDQEMDIPQSLTAHGIGMEKTEFGEIVTKVSGIVDGSNKLPWLLSARPMVALLLAGGLWIPAFIAVLVIHVDDDSGIALPIRLGVFLYPLGLVAAGYLIKWRRAYWLTKIVRLLVQNCIDVNQALYFQGRPLFTTAAHVRANVFAIYFVYFDATDCVRSVDLLLITCMEDDWEKLLRLITFYTRDENYLSRMSVSERLTVMMSAPYLVKLVRQVLPHPPQQRHVSRLLCLCQFTEECISRFAHGFDREDVPGLAELFTRHLPGKVSGSAVRRVQEELFHANHGLVP